MDGHKGNEGIEYGDILWFRLFVMIIHLDIRMKEQANVEIQEEEWQG